MSSDTFEWHCACPIQAAPQRRKQHTTTSSLEMCGDNQRQNFVIYPPEPTQTAAISHNSAPFASPLARIRATAQKPEFPYFPADSTSGTVGPGA